MHRGALLLLMQEATNSPPFVKTHAAPMPPAAITLTLRWEMMCCATRTASCWEGLIGLLVKMASQRPIPSLVSAWLAAPNGLISSVRTAVASCEHESGQG